jgi:D-alanyl-D-alanine carboxypeptidase/D-alanyl-D-alanine-endopeptidase (penicillin-binding protein 4)
LSPSPGRCIVGTRIPSLISVLEFRGRPLHKVNAFFNLLAGALGLSLGLITSVSAADIAESAQVVHSRQAPLPAPVGRVMERYKLAPSGVSFFVQALDSDTPLLSFNAEVPRNPASTIKTLTTMVALDVLTPGYYWKTYVYLDGELHDGRLEGNLVLKGTGDPYLTTENFWKLLRELRARGLQHISGDLVVDNSYFQVTAEDPGAFDGEPFRSYNVAPDALLVNFKSVRFGFYPEPGGKGVRVVQDPLLANLRVDNRLTIRPGSCSGFQRGIAFNVPEASGHDTVLFDGKFPSGCQEYSFSRTVMAPAQFAFGVFKGLWEELGGSIDGGVRTGLAPQTDESGNEPEPFYVHWSPTLAEVVRSINKYSNNVMTRHLLLTLGARVYGEPGTEEKGRAVIADWLKANKLDLPELVLVNGAGLSRDTRISAASLAALLRYAWSSPYMPEFVASLPLSGMDGTLRRRFDDEPLAGQLHLKTGSMDDVAAIAGYATSRSGRRYVVVDLHNEKDVHRGYGENVQDALLRWVIAN